MAGVSLNFDIFGHDRTASRALKGVGSAAESTHGKLGKFGSVGKSAGLAVAGGIGLAAAGIAAAVPVVVSAVKAGAEDEAQQRKLALALKNSAGARKTDVASVETWISRQGEALGVTDDQLRPALSRLVRSTHDVGKAQGLASLAMDVSAGTGKDLSTVSGALGKAYDGNTGALGRLGIKTKDASGHALSLKQITANMAQTFKGQASAAAETFKGKMDRLKLIFNEAKESVGSALLPALTKVGSWILDKGVPAVRQLAADLMPKLRDMFASVKKVVDDNRPGLESLGRILVNVGKFIVTKVVPAWIALEGVVVKVVVVALAKLGEVLPPIASGMLRGIATIVGGFRGLVTAALSTFGGILKAAAVGLGWIPGIGPKIKTASEGFSRFKDSAVSKLKGVEAGLHSAADKVDDFGRKAKSIPEAKIKADIHDLLGKLVTARDKLKDPDLTKERRAEIKADTIDLKTKLTDAKRRLADVRGKNVVVNARINWSSNYPGGWKQYAKEHGLPYAHGGLVRGPGTGTSDSIAAKLSAGEYVSSAASVAKWGVGLYDALNSGTATGSTGSLFAPLAASPSGQAGVTVVFQGGTFIGTNLDQAARDIQAALLRQKRTSGVLLGLA